MPFEYRTTALDGVVLVEPRAFADERGYFLETYKRSDFANAGIPEAFVQDNHSCSSAGTVRGLHYQLPPDAQGKLIRVVTGAIFDVAVDIRRGSSTFGRWIGAELSADNHRMLYVPPGFAHGFLALRDDTHLFYKCTAEYKQPSERAIRFDDPEIGIEWPPLPEDVALCVNDKDAAAPYLVDAEVFT